MALDLAIGPRLRRLAATIEARCNAAA